MDALSADLAAWARADRDPQGYDAGIERTRASYGALVGMPVERINRRIFTKDREPVGADRFSGDLGNN